MCIRDRDNGIEAFVKYNYFHKEQRPRYTPNPFHAESLHYNAGEDNYVCPMGQHMNRIGTKRDKTASGYIIESARYKAKRCEGCPLRGSCFKARGNRIIEVNHRLNQYKRQMCIRDRYICPFKVWAKLLPKPVRDKRIIRVYNFFIVLIL